MLLARFRPYAATSIFALLIFYFGVHGLVGDRGLLTRSSRDEALAEKSRALQGLIAERRELETRVRLLGDGSLSRDLLEERATTLLGFVDPRDYVIRVQRPEPASGT